MIANCLHKADSAIVELDLRLSPSKVYVVAQSMGGFVSRGAVHQSVADVYAKVNYFLS